MNRYKNTKKSLTFIVKNIFSKNKFFSLIKKILFGTLQIENIGKSKNFNIIINQKICV